jgi:predicted phosphodiesterase
MALVIGDLHGNLAKTHAFLSYEPDVEHICLGDYVDSLHDQPVRHSQC